MVAQRSLLFAAASAFTVSNVIAHPHAHHAHVHAKRQDKFELSYVTLHQTQPAGPNGTAIVYTLTSPVWVPAGAAATATGYIPIVNDSGPAATPSLLSVPATPTAVVAASSTAASSSAASSAAAFSSAASSSAVVEVSSVVVEARPSISIKPADDAIPATTPVPETPETPETSETPSSGQGTASGAYKDYSGTPSEYPAKSEWLSFDAIFEAGKGDATKGMLSYQMTEDQMSSLKSGIKAAAASTGVDPRVVLAMALQETRGVATTGGGGLIQATGVNGQLCDGSWSDVQKQLECGLTGVWAECTGKFPESSPWIALRCYNSGALGTNAANLNTLIGPGTAAYVTDIANRLTTGWTN